MGSSQLPARWVVSGHSYVRIGWKTLDYLEKDKETQGSSCAHVALANSVGLLLAHVSTIFQKPIKIVTLKVQGMQKSSLLRHLFLIQVFPKPGAS